jgi:hypothetical protein
MLNDKYTAAFIFYLLGLVWVLGWWLMEHPAPRRSRTKLVWTKKQKKYLYMRWGGASIAVVITAVMCIWTSRLSFEKRLQLRSDWLVPADDPMPDNDCARRSPTNSLVVMLGDLTAWDELFPHIVLAIRNKPILTVNRNEQGRIAVTTDVMDDNDNAVVEIVDNHFTVASDAFKVERPDLSTLSVVIAHHKEQVLNIRYANPRTLKITGTFRSDSTVVRVTQSKVELDSPQFKNFVLSHDCIGGSLLGDFMF